MYDDRRSKEVDYDWCFGNDLEEGAGEESLVLNGNLNLDGEINDALNGTDHDGKNDEDGEGTDRNDDEGGDENVDREDNSETVAGKEYANNIDGCETREMIITMSVWEILRRLIKILMLIPLQGENPLLLDWLFAFGIRVLNLERRETNQSPLNIKLLFHRINLIWSLHKVKKLASVKRKKFGSYSSPSLSPSHTLYDTFLKHDIVCSLI